MNFIWNMDGLRIMSVCTNRWAASQLWTSGYAQNKIGELIQWEATALAGGWYIVITKSTGRVGEVQGATFNLPLEIATAIARLA